MSYVYLNRDGRWPLWSWSGLDLGRDGALTLAAVPRLAAAAPQLASLPAPDGPAGVAVAAAGAVFYSDPGADRLWRIDPCDGTAVPVPCFGGSGGLPTRLRRPRGLLLHPTRGLLLVADSGNHRIQLLDPESFALAGIWGQADPAGTPRPGREPGQLDTPWNLAADPRGDVYVVDYGNRRVQKLGERGDVVPSFWQQVAGAGMALPVAVAVRAAAVAGGTAGEDWEVLVLDGGAAPQICVFTPAGQLLRQYPLTPPPPPAAPAPAGSAPAPSGPLALAAGEDRIYVGDNGSRAILVLAGDGTLLGEAEGFAGPVAALALAPASVCAGPGCAAGGIGGIGGPGGAASGAECECGGSGCTAAAVSGSGGLWLHPGSGSAPLQLDREAGRLRSGMLRGGPFEGGGLSVLWHQLKCLADQLVDGAHLRLYFATGDGATGPPVPLASSLDPFAPPAGGPPPPAGTPPWMPLPPDALQGLIRATARHLWLGAHFSGEGRQSARLSQVRVDFAPETWSQYLPVIYREQSPDPELLERFLALFASAFEDIEGEIRGLGRFLDVAGAPASWLPWLAGWVGLELEEAWSPARQREAIAGAFAAATHRGTVAGLQRALRFWAGVDARLAEPILYSHWWSLPAAGGAAFGCGAAGWIGPGSSGSCACGIGTACGSGCAGAGDVAASAPASGGGLGFDTVLAPAGIEGAVVGTTAVLDRSFLAANDDRPGAHLYAEVAHQFAVQVYERQVADPRRRAQLIATLDREKPAHTAYHLCVIAPRMRVGFQARLGVDTVVAGPAPPRRLGGGGGPVLGGAPPGRIGKDDRVGIGTRLGAGTSGGGRARGGRARRLTSSGAPARLTREEEPWP